VATVFKILFNSSRWGFPFLPPAQKGDKKAADLTTRLPIQSTLREKFND